jgi:hypothetical protein
MFAPEKIIEDDGMDASNPQHPKKPKTDINNG